MKNNETGEFELVMGNRQLLSGFFIVCLLFGVAFAMGYIVGRNSSPSARALAEMQTPAQAPVVSDARPPATGPAPGQAVAAEPPKTGEQTPPETASAAAPPPEAAKPAEPEKTEKPAEGPPTNVFTEPPAQASGSYWQVMAVKQPEAEVVLRTLKDKGFPATLSPGPNNLVRVLVGPYGSRETLGKAKAELENAGFHPMLKK